MRQGKQEGLEQDYPASLDEDIVCIWTNILVKNSFIWVIKWRYKILVSPTNG